MKRVLICLTAVFLLLRPGALAAEDDVQYWSQYALKPLDTKYVDFVNYWELRFIDDFSDLGFWQTSQKLIFDAFKYLSFGTNYTYLQSAKTAGAKLKSTHRFELEMNPHYEIKKWIHVNIKNRNRVEFRWIEGQGSDNTRFRHRLEFEFPVRKIPGVKSVYINDEIFIASDIQELNENRAVPLGIAFKLFKNNTVSVFYMIQSKKGAHDWSSNQILGTSLSLSV